MNYIPIEIFKDLFSCSSDQELWERHALLNRDILLESIDKVRQLLDSPLLSVNDLEIQFDLLNQESTLVYHQWIQQSPNLKELILNRKLKACDFRAQIIKEHFLFCSFQDFVSPFLISSLLLKLNEGESLKLLASYLPLLNELNQSMLQSRIQDLIENSWLDVIEKARTTKNEKDFIRVISAYFSDEKVAVLNHFNKAFYHLKITWIEQALEILKLSGSSYRVAYWLVNQLKKLDLNPEHQQEISDLWTSLQKGDGIYVKKRSLLGHGTMFKRPVFVLFILTIVLFGVYFAVQYATWFDKAPEVEMNTSFEQFDEHERKQLDSLIRSMDHKKVDDDDYRDDANAYLHLTPVSIPIVAKTHFENRLIDHYVDDCFKAIKLIEVGKIDSCLPYDSTKLEKLIFPSFKPLNKNKGSKSVYFRNASDYQVLLLVFDDKNNAPVFAKVFASGDQQNFKIEVGQQLMVLPGSNLGKFIVPNTANELPSKDYKHHFCLMDTNFEHRLFNAYVVKKSNVSSFKLLANSSSQGDFYLVDLQEALEE